MTSQAPNPQERMAQILERAARDQQFRQQLQQNPKGVIEQEFGIQLSPNLEVSVVEDTPNHIYIPLPPAQPQAGQELSDQELEAVAGGWSMSGCNTCQFITCGCI